MAKMNSSKNFETASKDQFLISGLDIPQAHKAFAHQKQVSSPIHVFINMGMLSINVTVHGVACFLEHLGGNP